MMTIPLDHLVFEKAVKTGPSGVIVLDKDGAMIFVNHQIERIFGYPAAELVGRRIDVLLSLPQRSGHAADRARGQVEPIAQATGTISEVEGRRRDGAVVPVEVGLTVVDAGEARVTVASVVDVTARRQLEAQLQKAVGEQLAFEQLVSTLAAHFVGISLEQVDAAILDGQRRIVEALDLDRSTLWSATESGELIASHIWARPEQPPTPPGLPAKGLFPFLTARLLAGEDICFTRVADVPSAVDRDSLTQFGVKSSATLPLMAGDRIIGAISFGAMRAERQWPPNIVERLRLLATVFAHALARKATQEKLQRALNELEQMRDQLARENVQLRHEVKALRLPRALAAESAASRRLLDQIESVAPTNATVLLLGETGTGKEVVAEAIHELSKRHRRPMVRVNCAAIPLALIESELFGRERGAYTGAVSQQRGRFEMADGSTIFLDEVGELPLEVQVKLLRVLETRVVERLGGGQPVKVDVRVIAATNRDLQQAIAERKFRDDLFYRLNVCPVTVPPLRERPEDIPVLVWSFIDEFSKALDKKIESVAKPSLLALQQYSWPGNIRELRNVIERAIIFSTGTRLTIELPSTGAHHSRVASLEDVQAHHIREVLDKTRWRIRGAGGAAERLGMKPTTLESRMKKFNIQRPEH
jgi:formate hydrogenlyase transcriptional activator